MALPSSIHSHPHFNAEEAAHVVTGLVSNLENLPGEVTFLLEEIREKDIRISQLVQRINSRHMSLTKTARSLTSLPPSTATFPLPLPPGAPLPTSHLSLKDQQSLTKIQTEWSLVLSLQDDKVKLAERLDRIVCRAKERVRYQWTKVGGIDVEEFDKTGASGNMADLGSEDIILPSTGLGSGFDSRPVKKRRPNALPIQFSSLKAVHPSISMPPPPPPSRPSLSARSSHSAIPTAQSQGYTVDPGYAGGSRHRSSRQVSLASEEEDDEDAEGEPDEGDIDMVDGGDAEGEADESIYCICQQRSYGEMIGCDNDGCKFEWFHVKCVDISGPLPETWYCPDCVSKYGYSNDKSNKKSRKR
ncbi:hypothetical protein L204_105835 [Cryptococcus depauperatus]|nr:hypothetical protein L204_06107 [Cryptococcus depauperatus CBS 7855]